MTAANFHNSSTSITVADFCEMYERNEVIVNRDYQRSSGVWPISAQSFLIESILLGYPIPKLSLHQITDIKTRRTTKEIIDGQQRTHAIVAFFKNDLTLSGAGLRQDLVGKNYEALDDDLKGSFLSYLLAVDLFIGATAEDIREMFRRINSFTVPLSPEELRHADNQGAMKWFIYRLTKDLDDTMIKFGVFKERQLIRMLDAKLFSEIIHALIYGISTTKKSDLDKLYKDNDSAFVHEREIRTRIVDAIRFLEQVEPLFHTSLFRPHIFYSLLLAVTHAQQPSQQLPPVKHLMKPVQLNVTTALSKLTLLVQVMDGEIQVPELDVFVKACKDKTNVKSERLTRFQVICDHLLAE